MYVQLQIGIESTLLDILLLVGSNMLPIGNFTHSIIDVPDYKTSNTVFNLLHDVIFDNSSSLLYMEYKGGGRNIILSSFLSTTIDWLELLFSFDEAKLLI